MAAERARRLELVGPGAAERISAVLAAGSGGGDRP
jgi:hypothetical protein